MIYLGFYLGHDANVAVSVNGQIKYRKAERVFARKHAKADLSFVWDTLKDWGINKVDYCAYTDGNRHGLGRCAEYELFCAGALQECQSFCLDHYYAHSLSLWPVVDTKTIDYSICVDGRGDWNRSMMIIKSPAHNPQIVRTEPFPSLGFEFFKMGRMLGFKGLEYDLAGKLMGLQGYSDSTVEQFGIPALKDTPYKTTLKSAIDDDYETYNGWHEYWWRYLRELFAFPKQAVIGYSGGCAQNTVYNYRLKKEFPNLYIPPHCYDGGLSLGCLEFLRLRFGGQFDGTNFPYWQDDEIKERPTDSTIRQVAKLLYEGKIVGWMQGKGELGPRALGNRSILMRADIAENKKILNERVKRREPWRPYAGSILQTESHNYFDMPESKHMLYACKVQSNNLQAITHVDDTCRMQTVTEENGDFHQLLSEYNAISGCPVLLNTSLNVMGDPIASSWRHGLKVLHTTDLDAICVGNSVYTAKLRV